MALKRYNATKCIHEINTEYKVDAPIVKAMHHILYDKISSFS